MRPDPFGSRTPPISWIGYCGGTTIALPDAGMTAVTESAFCAPGVVGESPHAHVRSRGTARARKRMFPSSRSIAAANRGGDKTGWGRARGYLVTRGRNPHLP